MVLNDRIAQALDTIGSKPRLESIGSLKPTNDLSTRETNPLVSNTVAINDYSFENSRNLGEVMFGPFSSKKILCECGAIADIDSTVVRLKHKLGKEIECTACRNQRIARELEALQAHFTNPDEEHW
ncbi:MAG: hypothetical protein QHH00_03665 [Methanomassiliicoccales archaeon]|jgi:hypothetical protein|nr:hypothetical protein [Methanomassiliicoccales archaeon]